MYRRKKRIEQLISEAEQEQEWACCLDCGDDAFCEYDEASGFYECNCQNEDCPHHWPPYKTKNKDKLPDWFIWAFSK